MPTVPSPSRSAFGAGLAQAQFGAAQASLNLASSLSGAAQTIFQTQNKEKFREDAITRSSDRREFRMKLRQDVYRRFYENNPTSSADVEAFKEEVNQLAGEYAQQRKYNLPDSKAQLMVELDEIAGQFILEADAVARQGGQRVVMEELDDLTTRLTDQIAENPSSLPDAIVTVDRAFAEEGIAALGVGKADEARNMVVSALARQGVESALVKRNFVGVEQIMGNEDVRRAMTAQERSKVISAIDSAKILAKQEDRQHDLNQATLVLREAQALSQRANARLTNAQADEKELANLLTRGGRKPSEEEAETLRQARLKTEQARRNLVETNLDVDAKTLANARAQAEWDYEQKHGLAVGREYNTKASNWYAANQRFIDAEGKMPPDRLLEGLNLAVASMQGNRGPNDSLGTPPAPFTALASANGVQLYQYAQDPQYAARVQEQLFGGVQQERGQADTIGHNIANAQATTEQSPADAPPPLLARPDAGPASVSPDTSGPTPGQGIDGLGGIGAAAPATANVADDSVALTPTREGPTAAPAAVAGAGAGVAEGTVEPPTNLRPENRAFVAELAQEEPTPEKADKAISSVVSKNMQLYNNIDIAYGFWNSAKAQMFKFGPTSGVVGDQTARVQAREFLRGGLRQLIASVDHIGRFTDDYRKYLTQQFEYLQTSFWDNPDAIRGVMESMTMVLSRQYAEHYKAQQMALEGSASTTSATSAESGERMRAVKNMLKVIGAPVLIGRDFLPGEDSGELNVSTVEEFEAIAEHFVSIGLLEPGDQVKFGGQVYNVGLGPDEEGT